MLSTVQSALLTVRQTKRRVENRISRALSRKRLPSPDMPDKIQKYLQSRSIADLAQRMKNADWAASRGYRPQFYRGGVKFVRAEILSYFPGDQPRCGHTWCRSSRLKRHPEITWACSRRIAKIWVRYYHITCARRTVQRCCQSKALAA